MEKNKKRTFGVDFGKISRQGCRRALHAYILKQLESFYFNDLRDGMFLA